MQKRKDHANGLLAYRRINELAMRLLVRDGFWCLVRVLCI
jgi:23S rRNA (cytosine1962-C5)-methyltransferase